MPYGIVLRSNTDEGATDRLVSPADLATTLSGLSRPEWNTGLLTPATVWMGEIANTRTVVEYRKPQITGVWLEGSETALRVPLPGLLLVRTIAMDAPKYRVYAVKRRPRSLKAKLYAVPLPNTDSTGVCWGNVAHLAKGKRQPVSLEPDWQIYLGSKFGDHTVGGKSKQQPHDIRKLLIALDAEKAEKYPTADLVETRYTLGSMLNEVLK